MRVFCACVLALLVSGFAATGVCAQEDNNRDENGKIVRGPYETNRLFDNVWVGVGGGVNIYEHDFKVPGSFGGRLAPSLDINIGKWLTPSVGVRIGYKGLMGASWSENQYNFSSDEPYDNGLYKNSFGTMYIHGDVMWNLSNAISGYKETRLWNFVPFLSAGYARSYKSGVDWKNNELAVGVGLLNNIRLSNRVNLTLEFHQMIVKEGFDSQPASSHGGVAGMTSATFGVAINLGRTGFRRSNREALENQVGTLQTNNEVLVADNQEAKNNNDELQKENDALKAKLKEMEEQPKVVEKKIMLDVTPGAVFFQIGQTTLSKQELFHLDFYIKNVIEQDKDKVFTLTGYADKQTGSKKRNQQLSQMRVEYVYNLLQTKYNIPAERLVIKAAGSDVDRWGDPLLNRCVVLE